MPQKCHFSVCVHMAPAIHNPQGQSSGAMPQAKWCIEGFSQASGSSQEGSGGEQHRPTAVTRLRHNPAAVSSLRRPVRLQALASVMILHHVVVGK